MSQTRFRRAPDSNIVARCWSNLLGSLGLSRRFANDQEEIGLWRLESLEDRTVPSLSVVGSEFAINTTTADTQQTFAQSPQAVATDANGNFIVVWSSNKQDGNGQGVYARRYDSFGNPLGGEFRVNSTTNNDQEFSTVAMDATGDFVITWSSNNQDGNGWGVYAQRYDSTGNPLGGEFRVNTTTQDNQEFSTVAMDAAGDFVITWSSRNQDGNGWSIYARRYDSAGNPLGGEFQVNSTTEDNQEFSTVALDAAGNFVITWSSRNQDGNGWGIYAQRYDSAGVAQGGEFQINSYTRDDQKFSRVAYLPDGGFLITWSSNNQDGNSWGIYAQRYDASGTAQGNEFRVNTTTAGPQQNSAIAVSANGEAIVVWSGQGATDNTGIDGQRFVIPSIVVTPTSGLITTEAGGTATFSVVLTIQPSANVFIGLRSSDSSAGTVSTYGLVFTSANWNVPQTVTITGVDDQVVTSNRTYSIITAPAISADPTYNGLNAANVTVTNLEMDIAGIQVTPTSGLVTSKLGGTAVFSVVLASKPTSAVIIPLSSSNTNEGTLSTSSLTFTPANWNVPQFVTVTGVNDLMLGDVPYQVLIGPASSADPNYNNVSGTPVSLTNVQFPTPGITLTPTSGLTTTAAGGTAQFSVVLNSPPVADVTISLSSSNPSAGTVSTPSLTFTPLNWNVPQFVTITGFDDQIVTGNIPYQILTAAAVSVDLSYNGLNPLDVSVTNLETDVAAIRVTPISGPTSEAGGTATFSVVLTSAPTGNVTLGLSSLDLSAGTVSTPSLTFTPFNWTIPQVVTIRGVDDYVVTGDRTYVIAIAPASSADPHYNNLDAPDVSVINLEGDTAGIVVTPTTGLITTYDGGTATFSVVLSSKPTDDVILTFSSSDPAAGALSTNQLIFTPANWNIPQVVTVLGLNDPTASGDVAYRIVFNPAASADGNYNFLTAPSVSLVNLNDTSGATASPSVSSPMPAAAPPPPDVVATLTTPLITESPGGSLVSPADPGQFEVVSNLRSSFTEPPAVSLQDKKGAAVSLLAALGNANNSPLEQANKTPADDDGRAPGAEGNQAPGSADAAPALQPDATAPSGASAPARPPIATLNVPAGPAPTPAPVNRLKADQVHIRLGDAADQALAPTTTQKVSDAVFISGVALSVGYVFLSSRGGSFLISALTARPLWKQFDPLEVLFAWELEKDRRRAQGEPWEEDDDPETLQSLVDGSSSAQ